MSVTKTVPSSNKQTKCKAESIIANEKNTNETSYNL